MSSFLSLNFFSTQSLMEKISDYLIVLISQSLFDESHKDQSDKQDLEKRVVCRALHFQGLRAVSHERLWSALGSLGCS